MVTEPGAVRLSWLRRLGVLSVLLPLVGAAQSPASAPGPSKEALHQAVSLAVAADYEGALKLFRAELLRDPEDPLVNYYVGMTQYKLERLAAATVFLERAVEKKAPFPQAYYWLAKAYLELGKDSEASEVAKLGLTRFPANTDLATLVRSFGSD